MNKLDKIEATLKLLLTDIDWQPNSLTKREVERSLKALPELRKEHERMRTKRWR